MKSSGLSKIDAWICFTVRSDRQQKMSATEPSEIGVEPGCKVQHDSIIYKHERGNCREGSNLRQYLVEGGGISTLGFKPSCKVEKPHERDGKWRWHFDTSWHLFNDVKPS